MRVLDRSSTLLALIVGITRISAAEADPRLLLHLDFEADPPGRTIDATGHYSCISTGIFHVPGRVAKYGIKTAVDGYIRVPAAGTDLELAGTPYTIACWVLADPPEVFSSRPPEMAQHGDLHALIPLPYPETIVAMGDWSLPNLKSGYLLSIQGSRAVTAQANGIPIQADASPIQRQVWQHLAAVFDGNLLKLYTNGVLGRTQQATGVTASGTNDLLICNGSSTFQDGTFLSSFTGVLDDLRIYRGALSGDEVSALASAPLPEPRLVIDRSGGTLLLSWQATKSGAVIESTSSLGSDQWTPLPDTQNLTPDVVYWSEIAALSGGGFYRLRQP